ncbi:MAG: helix-turn-helix domain-containing protein [Nostoc sp.]|uniref:helix-turn-helix domain-containing protein n=1 Tax=Nostoc sp. TaxID=1180 RepID=UPI002FFAFE92
MLLNYQYHAYPNTNQKLELNSWLRVCRYWYNKQLGEKFDWWENNCNSVNACRLVCSLPELRDNPNFSSQKKQLPVIKEDLTYIEYSSESLKEV